MGDLAGLAAPRANTSTRSILQPRRRTCACPNVAAAGGGGGRRVAEGGGGGGGGGVVSAGGVCVGAGGGGSHSTARMFRHCAGEEEKGGEGRGPGRRKFFCGRAEWPPPERSFFW